MSEQTGCKSSAKQPVAAKPTAGSWQVYLVRAANGALYCGITTDPQRRLREHQQGRGARFFRSSPAQALVYLENCADKGSALRREIAIKRLTRPQKDQLVLAYAAQLQTSNKEAPQCGAL